MKVALGDWDTSMDPDRRQHTQDESEDVELPRKVVKCLYF